MKISRLGKHRTIASRWQMNVPFWRGSAPRSISGGGSWPDQLAPDFATPVIREALALLLCLFLKRSGDLRLPALAT